MEFWGIEVKAGKPFKVTPDMDTLIHISQGSLGESKGNKGESVPLFVKIGDQKLVMGTLSHEKFPQISFDLVFEREFEISHNWKNGSVYFTGYKSPNVDEQDEEGFYTDSEEESEEEELPAIVAQNGKPKAAAEGKKNVKSHSDVKLADDDSEEETPKKVEQSKKRVNESASKTPVSLKKAKTAVATPQKKTEEKKEKGQHTATPHPGKKGGKAPASVSQSPKSAGQVSCGPCKKSFNSENALQSHNKAKHSAGPATAAAK